MFSVRGLCSSAGGFFVCAGLDFIKLTKTPLIYSVSRFNLGGLGALFGGISPPKPPRGDGTATHCLRTTGLDQLTHRYVKLRQQVCLKFTPEPW